MKACFKGGGETACVVLLRLRSIYGVSCSPVYREDCIVFPCEGGRERERREKRKKIREDVDQKGERDDLGCRMTHKERREKREIKVKKSRGKKG